MGWKIFGCFPGINKRFIPPPRDTNPVFGSTQPLTGWVPEFLRGLNWPGFDLHAVQKLITGGAIYLLPLYSFVATTGRALPLTLTVCVLPLPTYCCILYSQ